MLFLADAKRWVDVFNAAATDLGENIIDDEGHTAFVLRFSNGRKIHSMSSNPDAQSGRRGSRILDEFALYPDPRKLYTVAYPGITWGGSLEIFSSHRGSFSFFEGESNRRLELTIPVTKDAKSSSSQVLETTVNIEQRGKLFA